MLDDRTIIPEGSPLQPFLTWKARDNVLAWTALIGEEKAGDPDADVSYYVAPSRAPSLAGLPPTYVDVGGLDLLREEIVIFVARLVQEHIEVEMHLWPGVPHSFENYGTSWTVRAVGSRIKALKTF
jgi:acetyl esterase/lipase